MTTHALLAAPPVEGLVLDRIESLDDGQAASVYAAMVMDTMRNVAGTGGELLVNYPPVRDFPEDALDGESPEEALRALAEDALNDLAEVRFEVQVGESFAERVNNTVTHLLEEEDADSVAVLDGRSPTLLRTALDSAAMKLRRNEVVLAPSSGGRVAYIGTKEPLDFERAFEPPEVVSLAQTASAAGLSVDFLPHHPSVMSDADLATLVASIRAHRAGDRFAPDYTAAAIEELGLSVTETDGHRVVTVD